MTRATGSGRWTPGGRSHPAEEVRPRGAIIRSCTSQPTSSPTTPEVRTLLGSGRAANLITATADGLLATMLPLVHDGPEARPGLGPWGALLGHVARNNAQWKTPAIGEAMVILAGPDAYISPAWYATKREHGRVVPTWNYITVHAYGRLVIHDDPALGRGQRPAADRPPRERRGPSPGPSTTHREPYIEGQLRAIVGVEILIDRVEGKWKLSQNRSDADIAGHDRGPRGDRRAGRLRRDARSGSRRLTVSR